MTYPEKIQATLNHLRIKKPKFLGRGEAGYVFKYSEREVVKIYLGETLEALKSLYELHRTLSRYSFSYQFPQIYEIRSYEGTYYTIEKKLTGKPMQAVYVSLNEVEKQKLLKSYFDAVTEMGKVILDDLPFGDLVKDNPLITSSRWSDYLLLKLEQRVNIARKGLSKNVRSLESKVEKLKEMIRYELECETKHLVHGDYFYDNLLVGEDLKISAVLDFSGMSVVGDHKMDITGTVIFLTLDADLKHSVDYVKKLAVERYGEEILKFIDCYSVYYAFYLSDSYFYKRSLYDWCLRIINS